MNPVALYFIICGVLIVGVVFMSSWNEERVSANELRRKKRTF